MILLVCFLVFVFSGGLETVVAGGVSHGGGVNTWSGVLSKSFHVMGCVFRGSFTGNSIFMVNQAFQIWHM